MKQGCRVRVRVEAEELVEVNTGVLMEIGSKLCAAAGTDTRLFYWHIATRNPLACP